MMQNPTYAITTVEPVEIPTEQPMEKEKAVKNEKADRPHLLFLDGMRGIAALYVVLFHAWMSATDPAVVKLSRPMETALGPMRFGIYAVDLFIVLSGFCLMLPVVNRPDGKLRGGAVAYLKRRAWRILPPYYAALALSWIMALLFPILARPSGTRADVSLPMFAKGVVVSHLLMVHNVHHEWLYGVNGALWSVATEWQIYFLLPLILLPAWRKAGITGLLIASVVAGLLPHYLLHGAMDAAKPHFAILFAMGAVAAVIATSDQVRYKICRHRVPFGAVTLLAICACALTGLPSWNFRRMIAQDLLVGIATAGLILVCANADRSRLRRSLESPFALAIGRISYSLYLIHSPILLLVFFATLALPVPHVAVVVTSYLVGIPLSLAVAYLFYMVVERRCINKKS